MQYWVGDFFVDVTRNQITQSKQSQTIAPKALAVLTYLAENQGKVVSHDALLEKVWQDTAVTPNTLQRSIAQLRRALGDDGKVQRYIKTHAKQGYSLECDVRWYDDSGSTIAIGTQENAIDEHLIGEANHAAGSDSKPKPSKFGLRWMAMVAAIIILGVIGYQHLAPEQTQQITFDTLRTLTATDDKEFDATYTPDGQYIVFHRYFEKQCINKLWAKNINTQVEFPLTEDWGSYGGHSLSGDGRKLVFLANEACSEPYCYNLMSLDFEKALDSPQQPSLMLQCNNSEIRKPTWLGDDNIAMLQKKSNRWKLINYSVQKNESTDLYDLKDGSLVDFSYSVRDDLIAVVSIHNDSQHYIEMLKPDGRIVSSHKIERPQEIPKFRNIYPSFDPLNEQLIFSTGRQLFTLSYDGKVSKINLPFADRMALPVFHPNGKRVLLIKGPYDSDVVLLPLQQITETGPSQTNPAPLEQARTYASFERSILGEDYAVFQPGGDLIAFWSERSGEQQLWISDGNGPLQISNFPMDTYIRGIDWAEDGNSLLVNANSVLTRVYLDSNQKSFPMAYPVVQLFQWDSKNNSALLLMRIKGILKFVAYDLNNAEIREISEKKIKWALKSEDGRIIYKDHRDQFWQPGPVEDQRIKSLDNHGKRAEMFVMEGNVIYAINSDNQLWSYDLDNDSFKILGEVGEDVDYLTDINQTQLLMTIRVSAKKEVVELSVSE